MEAVYAALDTRLDRRLALKVMLPRYAADPAASLNSIPANRIGWHLIGFLPSSGTIDHSDRIRKSIIPSGSAEFS